MGIHIHSRIRPLMVVAGVPDMQGAREQSVWLRFQQIECSEREYRGTCTRRGKSIFFDTYWWTHAPDGDTPLTGPEQPASAAGFYSNLVAVRAWWDAELAAEGMMAVSLPSPKSTNGTFLTMQARASIIRQMLTRQQKWGPRYGVMPGYGINMQNGFQVGWHSFIPAHFRKLDAGFCSCF